MNSGNGTRRSTQTAYMHSRGAAHCARDRNADVLL